MLTNYLKIAFRSFMRNSVYSFINILGLSLGIAASLLIGLWVFDEMSYDKFHPNYNRLTKAWFHGDMGGEARSWQDLSYPVYLDLKTKHKDIRNATITDYGAKHLLTAGEVRIQKEGHYAEKEFLEVFHFELLNGDASQVLDDPTSIVLTTSTAKGLFGNVDPINKTVRIDNAYDAKVTGVLKDVPSNSSIKFEYLMAFELYKKTNEWAATGMLDSWMEDAFAIYAELEPGAELASVNMQLKEVLRDGDSRFLSKELFLYPMERWNLHGEFDDGKEAEGDQSDYVFGFAFLALGILAIACINFMNLSTARSQRRMREVGIRKVSGSGRKDLIYQFLGESMLICTAAFFIALLLVQLSLPLYNSLIEKNLSIPFGAPFFWMACIMFVFVTGLLSGSYPAFYLSSFNPANVLKGQISFDRRGILPRKFLVVFQFSFSILLIIGTIVVYQQIEFVRHRQPGFDRDRLITIPGNTELRENYNAIKTELENSGLVLTVTRSNGPITEVTGINFLSWAGDTGTRLPMTAVGADRDYIKTMGIKILEGRDFSTSTMADSNAVLISQGALDMLGIEDPIGAKVMIAGGPGEIVGVTENVVMRTPYEDPKPMYIAFQREWSDEELPVVSVRLADGDLESQLHGVELIFKKLNPSYPFQFTFTGADFDKKFHSISLIRNLMNVFAFLALSIACLGLFGLAAFTVERRTKEISVRRILGATTSSLVVLISGTFTRLVIISCLIACPLAWFVLNNFLEYYQHHITMSFWLLPIAGLSVFALTLIIVSGQTVAATNVNPTESLRRE